MLNLCILALDDLDDNIIQHQNCLVYQGLPWLRRQANKRNTHFVELEVWKAFGFPSIAQISPPVPWSQCPTLDVHRFFHDGTEHNQPLSSCTTHASQ